MCLYVIDGAEVTDTEADWRTVEQSNGPMVFLCCWDLAFWPLNRRVRRGRSFDLTQMWHQDLFTCLIFSIPALQKITKHLQSSLTQHQCNPDCDKKPPHPPPPPLKVALNRFHVCLIYLLHIEQWASEQTKHFIIKQMLISLKRTFVKKQLTHCSMMILEMIIWCLLWCTNSCIFHVLTPFKKKIF